MRRAGGSGPGSSEPIDTDPNDLEEELSERPGISLVDGPHEPDDDLSDRPGISLVDGPPEPDDGDKVKPDKPDEDIDNGDSTTGSITDRFSSVRGFYQAIKAGSVGPEGDINDDGSVNAIDAVTARKEGLFTSSQNPPNDADDQPDSPTPNTDETTNQSDGTQPISITINEGLGAQTQNATAPTNNEQVTSFVEDNKSEIILGISLSVFGFILSEIA